MIKSVRPTVVLADPQLVLLACKIRGVLRSHFPGQINLDPTSFPEPGSGIRTPPEDIGGPEQGQGQGHPSRQSV